MKVCFVLPRVYPGGGVGGYAVVYEYAARLADRGHQTSVLHLDPLPRETLERVRYVRRRRRDGQKPVPYATRPGTAVRSVTGLRVREVREADAVVATGWQTAAPVAAAATAGVRAYFIQHHETWGGETDEVNATWRLPLRKIVIATWLKELADEMGVGPVQHVPNAIEGSVFHVATPIEVRDRSRVVMLGGNHVWKRTADGIAAVTEARRAGVPLTLALFSTGLRPADLPDWVEWHHALSAPEVAALLNTAAMFVSASEAEGWPLPPAEAMACGCALVSSDIGGVRDYAHDGVSARLFPVGDVAKLAELLAELYRDQAQRQRLAASGSALISTEFSWDRSVTQLESALGLRRQT